MPLILPKEKAGVFTKCFFRSGKYTSVMPWSFSDSPSITRVAIFAIGMPVLLEMNGTVRELRGLTSIT